MKAVSSRFAGGAGATAGIGGMDAGTRGAGKPGRARIGAFGAATEGGHLAAFFYSRRDPPRQTARAVWRAATAALTPKEPEIDAASASCSFNG